MFRKSVFIMLFVCLLATISSAFTPSDNYPWDGQLEWKNGTNADWYNPANWNGTCPADGPGLNNDCVVMANQPGPRITGDANCAMLGMNMWDPTSWGWNDVNITITATAGNVNCGATIQINSWTDYDSYLGFTDLVSRAILNVYGGTITTPTHTNNWTNLCGIHIGGGASNYAMAYGMLNIYGGLVEVPRLELHFGEIGLYGGTLHLAKTPDSNFAADGNFVVTTDHPGAALNKIRIDGGTLILDGNKMDILNSLIASGTVVCDRGTLGTPVFTAEPNRTTLTAADVNYNTWRPVPANNATNIHTYISGDGNSIRLYWSESILDNPSDVNHDVYFGTTQAAVTIATKASPEYKGTQYDFLRSNVNGDPNDPCTWDIKDPNFTTPGQVYWWRIDEVNNMNVNKKGTIWKFTSHDGKPYNPKPANSVIERGLNVPLQLTWTAGDWASEHRVFFSTATPVAINTADANVYRGTVSSPVYPLIRLLEDRGTPAGPDWTLTAGKTYYWRIVEVNTTVTPVKTWTGDTWSFVPTTYLNIDDFNDYVSTDDVNNNWPDGYTINNCANPDWNGATGNAARTLIRDVTGKYLRYKYINRTDLGGPMYFSEAKRPYIGGTSFTGGGVISPVPTALRIEYRGSASNAADPVYDRMYLAIEDTAGNLSICENNDVNAARVEVWTAWVNRLSDLAGGTVNLQDINSFAIGFGVRCKQVGQKTQGGDGNVMFDNIRLVGSTCVLSEAEALTADLDKNCRVDLGDLDYLSNDWLAGDRDYNYVGGVTPPNPGPVVRYTFEAADVNVAGVNDVSGNGYTATVVGLITDGSIWQATGGPDGSGCMHFPYTTLDNQRDHLEVPPAAVAFMGTNSKVSISWWANFDYDHAWTAASWNWAGIFNADTAAGNVIENHFPRNNVPFDYYNFELKWGAEWVDCRDANGRGVGINLYDFGTRWSHWAVVKDGDANTITIYRNGERYGYKANSQSAKYLPGITNFRIGARGPNWSNFVGWLDDFRIYNYALSEAQVRYITTGGDGLYSETMNSPSDIKFSTPNRINFGDLAIMGQQWGQEILWP
jgi:hypothetical protein